ncbi:MAG: adenylyl-sulfate kinase [Nitrospira sp.]|nr:adenylyl-sulfate kinase [Nitrospira sp.]
MENERLSDEGGKSAFHDQPIQQAVSQPLAGTPASANVLWHRSTITRAQREEQNGHRSAVLWFTGLPASGKSTLAYAVEARLYRRGCRSFVLDGDNMRHGLCADLGFSVRDRRENIRRVGEVAKLFMEAGMIVLAAFISPYRADRQRVRGMIKNGEFLEIYCNAPLEICEARDVKGIYKRARAGAIAEFTGISSPYEIPERPDLIMETGWRDLETCVNLVIGELERRGVIESSVQEGKGRPCW